MRHLLRSIHKLPEEKTSRAGRRLLRPVFLFTVLLTLLLFCGCSSTASLQTIKDDIAAHTGFTEILIDGLEIDNCSIIKRNTDRKNDIDEIWVSVTGEDETIYATRNYKLTYIHYNDGWKFETYETYSDSEHQNETKALTTATTDDAQELIMSVYLADHASFKTVREANVVVIDDYYLSADEKYCKFYAGVTYDYPIISESVEIPLEFYFEPMAGMDSSWGWAGRIGKIEDRTLSFSDIEGQWGNDADYFRIGGAADISKISAQAGPSPHNLKDGETPVCFWTSDSACYFESFYTKDKEEVIQSWAELEWSVDEDDGTLYFPHLSWIGWEDKDNPYDSWLVISINPDGSFGLTSEPYLGMESFTVDGFWFRK